MSRKTVVLLDNHEERELAKVACEASNLDFAEFEMLVEAQIEHSGTGGVRRYQLYAAFDDILDRIQTDTE